MITSPVQDSTSLDLTGASLALLCPDDLVHCLGQVYAALLALLHILGAGLELHPDGFEGLGEARILHTHTHIHTLHLLLVPVQHQDWRTSLDTYPSQDLSLGPRSSTHVAYTDRTKKPAGGIIGLTDRKEDGLQTAVSRDALPLIFFLFARCSCWTDWTQVWGGVGPG